MEELQMIKTICYLISSISFGISVNNLVVWPLSRMKKAKSINKSKLQKISMYDGYLINQECLLDNASLSDRNAALEREIVQALKPILDEIIEYVVEENLNLMYTNLKTVKIETLKRNLSSLQGDYKPYLNVVTFKKVYALIHELLHLSSSYYDEIKKIAEVGFHQINYDDGAEVGRGLNEGFTELLSSRIDDCKPETYIWLVRIARLFELFFDNPRDMERLYFNHNLPGFIHYMEKFMPRDKLMNILLRLDKMYYFYDNGVQVFSLLELINIEKELHGYFVENNFGQDKILEFESIIGENKLSAIAFKREKMKLVKDIALGKEMLEGLEGERKMTA